MTQFGFAVIRVATGEVLEGQRVFTAELWRNNVKEVISNGNYIDPRLQDFGRLQVHLPEDITVTGQGIISHYFPSGGEERDVKLKVILANHPNARSQFIHYDHPLA